VADCALASTPGEWGEVLLSGLRGVAGADEVSFSEIDVRAGRVASLSAFPTAPRSLPGPANVWQTRFHEHPWFAHYLATGDSGAVRLSDVLPSGELLRSPYYVDFYRPRGLRFGLYAVISHGGGWAVGIGAGRALSDFSWQQREVFDALRRPLGSLWRSHNFRGLSRHPASRGRPAAFASLTTAEVRVAEMVAAGCRNQQIAESARVSVKAVEQHLTRIYRKLGISSRSQLVVYVLESRRDRSGH
jgi:DNA-binding CsgD family transcriptional regulator